MRAAEPRAIPFPLGDVRLGDDSVFVRARDQMLHLARVYPVDRLLAVFRANAGLDTRGAAAPGSWEDFGHPAEEPWGEHDYPGREGAQTANLLRGHYAGHFLSMLALAAASERDAALHAKVDEMVAGLAEVQAALAATGRYSHPGFLAAYGEWQFFRLEHFAPYGEIWAPYYTCHKIMAGLLDAHELTGSAQALEVVVAMGHWVASRLERLDHDRRQRMWALYIAGEFGGMNETLARLSVVADEPRLLAAARLFDQETVLDAGASGRDILDGMHANQHLPQLIGYVHEYELTGDRRYLDAAVGIFDQVVPGRMYAHGGTGESELWGPARTVAGDIGQRNAETCATYNLLKLARLLFGHTLEPRFMDYVERGLHNHILGSRRDITSDVSPEVTYMFPVHAGALPEFDNIGTCCGGTGLENHVKHHDAVFFRGAGDAAELWVNLYTPAELDWRDRGVRVTLETDQPFGESVRLSIVTVDGGPVRLAVHLRAPSWLAGPMDALIDGAPVTTDAAAAGYLTIDREWRSGETLTLRLPAVLRADGALDDPTLQSVSFGPSVLVARAADTTTLARPLRRQTRPGGSLVAEDPDPGAALRATGKVGLAGLRYEPVWNGSAERYHLYVRAEDPTLGFAGLDTGVPARRRDDGSTLLDDLWRHPSPGDSAALTRRLADVLTAGIDEALLTGTEARRVMTAAQELRGGADADRVAAAFLAATEAIPDVALPPRADLIVSPPPAASGWFTERPQVEVRAPGAARVEWRIGDGPWAEYRHPVVVEAEGIVRVEARAFDGAGRAVPSAREISVDTSPPVSSARVKRLGASVEITLTAADEVSGVESIRWEGEGTFWATFQEAFVRALTDDEQIIEFAAVDRAGNEENRQRLVLPPRTETALPLQLHSTSASETARSENDS
ncbi:MULTISPECIES: beta-L-arabinofuranosidase domain-containing protein [unclassified Microbacterium]|uniref:beta-L-arabinofuranosidase domain-containing protein n=1 Tax=unclassified Microbacterium TaxID=2609290 RepID=UPI003868DCC4